MKKNLLINFLKKITIVKISLFFSFYFGIRSYLDFATSDIFRESANAKQEAYAREVTQRENELQAKAKGINRFIKPNLNKRHPDHQIAWQYDKSGENKMGISIILIFFVTIIGTIRWIREAVSSRKLVR
ncbi:hypothetical protein OAF22_01995 [bacterium]|nr:hypothetical protein [bacterium]MDB4683735.1 hypothetical protein [bacterium]MDB4786086.1 hypothetical protein [bacterium]